jgi:ribosomal protein S18 acetylase RimI-like enzyme
MNVSLRSGRPEDAQACGAICYEAFRALGERHRFPPDFPNAEMPTGLFAHAIGRDDVYTVVAEKDGKIIGSNVLWENNPIAGVGPISVDPAAQGGSVGRRLMEDVLRHARGHGFETIRLVQACFNNLTMALYTKLGFDVREPLSVIQGPALRSSVPGYEVRPATETDVEECNELCRTIHGHDRHGDLTDAIRQGTATVVERGRRISGYASVIGFFGHAIGETNEDLKALISAASEFAGPGFQVPTRNSELLRWCFAKGLQIRAPMTLMSIGPYTEPAGSFLPSVLF